MSDVCVWCMMIGNWIEKVVRMGMVDVSCRFGMGLWIMVFRI